MFVRNGAVTPRPSRECDITFFVKARPKSVRQSRDSIYSGGAQGAERHRTVIPGVTRMSFPRVKGPPFLKMPDVSRRAPRPHLPTTQLRPRPRLNSQPQRATKSRIMKSLPLSPRPFDQENSLHKQNQNY